MLSGQRDNGVFGSGCLLDDLVRYVYNDKGCSLLLVGDNAQLPPVGSTQSPALEPDYMASSYQLSVFSFQLREVARQALDSGILSEATRIRDGAITIHPNGKDVIKVKGEEAIETIEASRRDVGAAHHRPQQQDD